MRLRQLNPVALFIIAVALVYITLAASCVEAEEQTRFRREFTSAYNAQRFQAMAQLIKANKDALTTEVRALITEAGASGQDLEERLTLLDLAVVMATMNMHWNNGDAALLAEAETALDSALAKEEERQLDADRWLAYERLSGNIVMGSHKASLSAAKVAPVIFPHWRHRLYYACTACHDELFGMKRTEGAITHEAFGKGGLCGRCHDGTISFASDKDCVKCHAAGLPGAERMTDTATAGLNEIEETAKRLGSGWDSSKLEKGLVPLDRFGDIDWEDLLEEDVWKPLKGPGSKGTDENVPRQTVVVFKPAIPGVKHVAFEHAPHTSQISCANCHKKLFEETAGGTTVSMEAIASGAFCGACHGKTAFKLADCNRCHAITPDRIPDGALVRQ